MALITGPFAAKALLSTRMDTLIQVSSRKDRRRDLILAEINAPTDVTVVSDRRATRVLAVDVASRHLRVAMRYPHGYRLVHDYLLILSRGTRITHSHVGWN